MSNGDSESRATREGGPFSLGGSPIPLLLVDSITEALSAPAGHIVVSGSHGGISAGHFALRARPAIVVFNDAGVGKDGAGVAALTLLQSAGLAACTVAHTSARIGDARSTFEEGVISHANSAAAALGASPGLPLREWLGGLRAQAPSTP